MMEASDKEDTKKEECACLTHPGRTLPAGVGGAACQVSTTGESKNQSTSAPKICGRVHHMLPRGSLSLQEAKVTSWARMW